MEWNFRVILSTGTIFLADSSGQGLWYRGVYTLCHSGKRLFWNFYAKTEMPKLLKDLAWECVFYWYVFLSLSGLLTYSRLPVIRTCTYSNNSVIRTEVAFPLDLEARITGSLLYMQCYVNILRRLWFHNQIELFKNRLIIGTFL